MNEKQDPTAPEPQQAGPGAGAPAPGAPGAGGTPPPPPPAWTGAAGAGGAPPPAGPTPSGTDSFFDSIRRTGLVRSDERWIGGVGGGLALRLGVDPLVVRGLLAVSVLLGGIGLVVYAVGWLLLPEQRDGRIHLQQLFRGDFDAAVVGGFAMLLAGLSFPDRWGPGRWWGFDSGWWQALLWISAVTLVVVLVVSSAGRRGSVPPVPPGAPRPPAGGPTTGTTPAGAPPRRRPEGPVTTLYPTAPSAPHGAYPAGPAGAPASAASYPTAQYQTAQYPTTQYPTAQHTAQQHPTGAPYAPSAGWQPPAVPATPLPPVKPKPRGPGASTFGVVVALALLVFAGLLYASRVGQFDGPVLLTSGAAAVVILGIAIIVSGLRGRTAGGLGALAVLTTIALVPISALERADTHGEYVFGWDDRDAAAVGNVDRTPTTVDEVEAGYSVGAGNVSLDLTELDLDPAGTVVVPIEVGAGDIEVLVPDDVTVEAGVRIMAGQVHWFGDKVLDGAPGGFRERTFSSEGLSADAEPDLRLEIEVGAGRVEVREDR